MSYNSINQKKKNRGIGHDEIHSSTACVTYQYKSRVSILPYYYGVKIITKKKKNYYRVNI